MVQRHMKDLSTAYYKVNETQNYNERLPHTGKSEIKCWKKYCSVKSVGKKTGSEKVNSSKLCEK